MVEHHIDLGVTAALDQLTNVAHFYIEYVFIAGVAMFDKPPSTPSFTHVLLKLTTADNTEEATNTNQTDPLM